MGGTADGRPRRRPGARDWTLDGALTVLAVAGLLLLRGAPTGDDGTRPRAAEASQPVALEAMPAGDAPGAIVRAGLAGAPSPTVRLLARSPRPDRHAAQAYERCFGPTALLLRPPNPPLCLQPPSPWRPGP